MTVHVRIPGVWRGVAGRTSLPAEGRTVQEALADLARTHPELGGRILTPDGRCKPHVHLFLNGQELPRQSRVSAAVTDGDEILVLLAMAGGTTPAASPPDP